MLIKAAVVWVIGLLSVVPYGTYYLFFEASRDQYALVITLVLFWVFGYWGVVGPLLAAVKIRAVFRAIELAGSKDEIVKALKSPDTKEAAIDLIAAENQIPRFLAARVYKLLISRPAESEGSKLGEPLVGDGSTETAASGGTDPVSASLRRRLHE